MKKLGKVWPGCSLLLFITTMSLVVLTSHAFAKYFKVFDFSTYSARPATFEFIATGSEDTTIFVDFGVDGETAPEYGTRIVTRTYDFSVRMHQTEVAALFKVELSLPSKLYTKVKQEDKTNAGVWVNIKFYLVNDLGLESESLLELTDQVTLVEQDDGSAIWAYSEAVPMGSNPQGQQDCSNFRIAFEVMNVEDTSTIKDAAIHTTRLGLNISATQID